MCPRPSHAPPSILGISFDGLPISGIVIEFLNVAAVFRGAGLRVLCDLGYDATLGRTRDLGWDYLPAWVQPLRSIGSVHPSEYTPELVLQAHADVVAGTRVCDAGTYDGVLRELAAALVETFARENVRILVVENGTLPDNPLFTEALYRAIAEHGRSHGLGRYVLWRDHDLMWSSEPHWYGPYPYPGVHRPEPGPHIHYAVTTEWMRTRLLAWAPSITCHVIPCRFVAPDPGTPHRSLRAAYGIPDDAYVIARCTRIVPQKSVERDLRLLRELQLRLAAMGDTRRVFLVVAGPTQEEPAEFERLRALEQSLALAGQVIWADGLLPLHAALLDPGMQDDRDSVFDLLCEADLSSFLTTYDYEGFGMPPGEAMVMRAPFIATTYEVYHDVYGSKGAVAPLWPIDARSRADEPVPASFLDWTLRVLTDAAYRAEITERNHQVVERFFSLEALAGQMRELFGESLRAGGNLPGNLRTATGTTGS